MTWHVVTNAQGSSRSRSGVWVSIEGKRDHRRDKEYRSILFMIALYPDAAALMDLKAGEEVALEVGADHDVGMIRIRRTTPHERGLKVGKHPATLVIRRIMREFPLPAITLRKAEPVKRFVMDGEALLMVLPGEMTRDLRTAQVNAALASTQ